MVRQAVGLSPLIPYRMLPEQFPDPALYAADPLEMCTVSQQLPEQLLITGPCLQELPLQQVQELEPLPLLSALTAGT